MSKSAIFTGYDPVNKQFFDTNSNIISKSVLLPDILLGQIKLYNLKLSVRDEDGSTLNDYDKIPSDATFEAIIENDYSNPDFEDLNNTDWTNTTGSEYQYDNALSAEPYEVYANNVIMTEGTAGGLAAGEYAWDSGTSKVTVRLSDSTNPTSKASGYVQYVTAAYTRAFVVVESDGFNAADSWYDTGTGTWRDPVIANGELTYQVDATTEDFISRISTSSAVNNTKFQLDIYESGSAEVMDSILYPFICRNRFIANPLSSSDTTVNIYNKSEQDARFVRQALSTVGYFCEVVLLPIRQLSPIFGLGLRENSFPAL